MRVNSLISCIKQRKEVVRYLQVVLVPERRTVIDIPFEGGGENMKTQKISGLLVLVLLLGTSLSGFPLAAEGGFTVTVTLSAGDHTVAIGAIAFTRHTEDGKVQMDHLAFDDPTYQQFKCQPGEVKSMTFEVPMEPNDLEIIYISDGGAQTPYTIPTDRFEFGKQYTLPSPSPGPPQEPPADDPPGDALISVMPGPGGIPMPPLCLYGIVTKI
jgi:hypothetical protein